MSAPSAGPIAAIKEKGLRYVAVSCVNVVVGQGLLLTFHAVLRWEQAASNASAVLISAIPAYYLSRAWVWGKSGRSHFKKEVLPFWIFVTVGLVFSTTMVALSSRAFGTDIPAAQLTLVQKLIPNLVNAGSFFILWIVRFFLMEKLFAQHTELAEELLGEDFIEAVHGADAVAAAEASSAARAELRRQDRLSGD